MAERSKNPQWVPIPTRPSCWLGLILGLACRYLYTEWEDPGFGPRAATVHQLFTQAASETLKEAISNQMQVIAQLKHINTDIKVRFGNIGRQHLTKFPVIAKSPKVSNLYNLHANVNLHPKLNATELPTVEMWHSPLGHMSQREMEQLSRLGYLPILRRSQHCIYGRLIMLPHKKILGKKEA